MNLNEIKYVCPIPSDLVLPDIVFKYRAVNQNLFSSLLLNQIWLAKPETFNDPFEPERIFSESPFAVELDRNVREAGVLCFCKQNDNLAMWSYYGDALRGLTIGYDLPVLLRDLKPVNPNSDESSPRYRYVYELKYCDDGLSPIQEMELLTTDENRGREYQKMFATKAAAFQHEKECRVVVLPSADSRPEWGSWSGHGLYQYAQEAVKEIIFGELMPKQDRQAILKIMEGRDVQFSQAVRDKTSFRIQVK